MFEHHIDAFLAYRRTARNSAEHTLKAYSNDLLQFAEYAKARELATIDLNLLRSFLVSLQSLNYARTTLARKQAALRAFFKWARRSGLVSVDPTRGLFA